MAVFEGLDTVAQVRVNGMPVGQANNMFRRYVFNITAAVRTGSNTITVAFQNAGTRVRTSSRPTERLASLICGRHSRRGVCSPHATANAVLDPVQHVEGAARPAMA